MLHEPALADSRRPLDQDRATAPGAGGIETVADYRQLTLAFEQPASETSVAARVIARIRLSPQVLDPPGQGTTPISIGN
jgi:hypothetical protein